MWAAAEGHNDVVSALLEAGAKPNIQAHKTVLTTARTPITRLVDSRL
jgi:ankyrin repeat protein